jgi:hypothetical protein
MSRLDPSKATMTTPLNTAATGASPAKRWRLFLGIVLAFVAPLGLGVAASRYRASLCPPDALICGAHGTWAYILTQAVAYLAALPPLIILIVAAVRSAAWAWRVLIVYAVLFVLLVGPLWMVAAAAYYGLTPRGIAVRNGPLGEGKLYAWSSVIHVMADCATGFRGRAVPAFKLTLIDGVVLDPGAEAGFAERYPAIAGALADRQFIYDHSGADAHCPPPYRDMLHDKPGARR